jgi:hypothetical protein
MNRISRRNVLTAHLKLDRQVMEALRKAKGPVVPA